MQVNGKTPLYLTLVAAAIFISALFLFQPYSADYPGSAYAKPARHYIRAVLHRDSAALVRLSSSPPPVTWGLEVARNQPDSLEPWRGRVEAWIAERHGDTTDVLVYGAPFHPRRVLPPGPCEEAPIVLRFVGSGDGAKVADAESKCLDPDTRR